ncbi:MAG TPA: sugar phosphate isomerase/epimerase [Acidimicrobiia bacterium]|nr:sugar phosphate isomerase/epimerase [Acidimicrobiia bacterium]
MSGVRDRIAGAPITWGVCEVAGWGYQLSPGRVLAEMAAVGLAATELGPQGFLPTPPDQLRRLLQGYGLRLVGGFLPLILHEPSRRAEEVEKAETAISQLAAGGADMLVLAADTGETGYEQSSTLDQEGWREVASSIDAIEEAATRRGLSVSLHPHYGTLVESPQQVDSLLAASPVSICLDTGHLLAGGGDPVALAGAIPDRITHCHLKDVDAETAAAVRGGRLSYYQAVKQGMYRPLGEGDVDVAAIVSTLEQSGYQGWYVLEQDVVLDSEPGPEAGPVESARRSLGYLEALLTRVPG